MESSIESRLKHWYLLLIFGVISIFLGVLVFMTPVETFLVLSVFFSYAFMIAGLLEAIYSISNRDNIDNWGWYLALGILTFILGFQLVLQPEVSMTVLTFYVGFWLLFRSMMYISSSIDMQRAGASNWGWVLIFGILGVVFSWILLWNPFVTSIAVSIWIGCALISLGFTQIIVSFSMKKVKKQLL